MHRTVFTCTEQYSLFLSFMWQKRRVENKAACFNELILILLLLMYFSWCLSVNQVLSTRIVAMKASLCKLSSSTIARVCDYHAKLFLIAISCTLKSLLRPHFLNTPDKSPGDRLTEICSKITDIGSDCL